MSKIWSIKIRKFVCFDGSEERSHLKYSWFGLEAVAGEAGNLSLTSYMSRIEMLEVMEFETLLCRYSIELSCMKSLRFVAPKDTLPRECLGISCSSSSYGFY